MTKLQPGELYEKIMRLDTHLKSVLHPSQESLIKYMAERINEVRMDYRDTFNIVRFIPDEPDEYQGLRQTMKVRKNACN